MRVKAIALVLVLLLPGFAAQADEARRAGILEIIGAQLEAFQRDDAPAAFAFASPDIQAMFGTPDKFLKMVAEAYQPVYRPRALTYLDLIEKNGRHVQRVLFTVPDGKQVLALYMMARQPDGPWRIAGCVLVDSTGQAA